MTIIAGAMAKIDLEKDNLIPLCLRLSIPTAISQAVQVLYAIVDRMYIGHIDQIGTLALSAVGIASPITSLVSSFSVLIGLGGAPIMAMRLGGGEKDKAADVMSMALYLLIAISIILTPLFFFLRNPLLSFFGATEANMAYASTYLGWYLVGTPFIILASGLSNYLINQGQSRKAMIAVLTATVFNVVLDPLFIFVFNMDVKGAAIATVISQAVQLIITLHYIRGKDLMLPLSLKKVNLPGAIMFKIFKFGLSPFIIIATDSLLMILLNTMLSRYGKADADLLITASAIIQSFHLLVMNPLGGITAGCQGLLSYNYGAGNSERVKKGAAIAQLYAVIYSSLMFAIIMLFSDSLVLLFTSDETVAAYASHYLKLFELMIIPLAFQYSNVDAFTALAEVRFSLPLSLGRKLIFLIAILTLPRIFTADTAFFAEPVADLLGAIISTTLFWSQLPRILRRRKRI